MFKITNKKTFSNKLFKSFLKGSISARFYGDKNVDHHDHHHSEYVPYNNGTKNNMEQYASGETFPEPENFAVGIERYEIDKASRGETPFNLGTDYITGPHFGTVADPVLINSFHDERIVGCAGKLKKKKNHI